MARALLLCLATFCILLPPTAIAGLWMAHGPEALLRLTLPEIAVLVGGLSVPAVAASSALGRLAPRPELGLLRSGLERNAMELAAQQRHLAALAEETRAQNELLREQARLTLEQLRGQRRLAETAVNHFTETRLLRLTAEWDLTARELRVILAAMFRLAYGTQRMVGSPGDDSPVLLPVALPTDEDLPLAILRLLPRTAEDVVRVDVDDRFVRQAARYRATFGAFLDRAPETGSLSRSFFRSMIYGRIDERLALLPRPDDKELGMDMMAAE